MLYTLSIPTSERLLIEKLINTQHDCCYHYHPWLKVSINPNEYVVIGFAHGKIDNRAVFVHLINTKKHKYLDMPLMYDYQLLDYFNQVGLRLQNYEKVWMTVLTVYLHTKRLYSPRHDWVLSHLIMLNKKFSSEQLMWLYLVILHLAMVSEEFYTRLTPQGVKGTVLGKRMKFIGLYQVLRLHWRATDAAVFSRHQPSSELEACFQYYWLRDQRDPKVKGVTNEYFRQLFM